MRLDGIVHDTMISMIEQDLADAAEILKGAKRVAVLTGAGVSAESGVPTFRGAGGLWEGHPLEEVATPWGFQADPELVWRFYEHRRRNLARVAPNPAHRVLARWRDRFESYTLITQNVDGLHQAAGAEGVLELHGNIWKLRCVGCGHERIERAPLATLPPRCVECGDLERPGVVWFGEDLPLEEFFAAEAAAEAADALVSVGTSAIVYPAAGLVEVAAASGGSVIEVNPEPSALAHMAAVALEGPAGELLPRLDAILAGSR